MAYFSKDAYERKREYAARVANDGLTSIAKILALKDLNFTGDSSEEILSSWDKYLESLNDDAYNYETDKLDSLIQSYEDELEPLKELSYKRHEIHSTDRGHFVAGSYRLTPIGTQYSEECLISEVNELNRKYGLSDKSVPLIKEPECDLDIDSIEDVLDYYGIEVSGDEDEDREAAHNALREDWDNCINQWSESVRDWFSDINQKFGSDFPD